MPVRESKHRTKPSEEPAKRKLWEKCNWLMREGTDDWRMTLPVVALRSNKSGVEVAMARVFEELRVFEVAVTDVADLRQGQYPTNFDHYSRRSTHR